MHRIFHYWDKVIAPAYARGLVDCLRSALIVAAILVSAFASPCRAQSNGVFREIYTGLSGSSLLSLTNNSSFPNSPATSEITINYWEGPGNYTNYYGDRYRALLVPPVTGSYTFWVQGDDAAVLYLSPDESPNNKIQVAYNTTSALFRAWYTYPTQQTPSFYLEAGRKYYIEGIHSAGAGDDAFAVGWKLPDGSYEQPMTTTYLYPYGLAAVTKPVITAQPTNVAVLDQTPAVFRVGVSNFDAVTYQWQRNATNLPGARGATLTIPGAMLADHGASFRCIVSNSFGSVTSVTAGLSVSADTVAPVLSDVANLNSNLVQVTFSEPVSPATGTNFANYSLNNGATVLSAAVGSTNTIVVLKTSALQRGSNYALTVSNVRDLSAASNAVTAGSQKSFTVLLKGIYREVYTDIAGSFISELTNSPAFPAAPSSVELMTNLCETPSHTLNNFGQRLRALIIPPVTGSYSFWIAAHDSATLSLGTSSSPSSAQVIASVTRNGDVATREWTIQPNQHSATITLTAGQQYYFEVLMKSGLSQQFPPDHLAVRWQLPDGTIEEPISVARFTPVGLTLPTIARQPASTNAFEGGSVTFSVAVSNIDSVTYQWQQNGTNLVGATNATYTNPLVPLANNGFTYRCLVSNAQGTTNSSVATLAVAADTIRPTIVSVANNSSNKVVVTFSELVDPATAATLNNYAIGGIAVASPVLAANGRTVTLNTSPMQLGSNYTMTINRVRDRAATYNVIATNSQFTFTVVDFFPQDVGVAAGTVTPIAGGADIAGGNNDFSGTNDFFNFAYQKRVGDFDVKVRVAKLDFADTWSTATLMAREDLNATNRYAAVCATPSVAGCFFQYRTNNATIPGGSGTFPVNFPYTWLRLQRRGGSTFSGYASVDGKMWTRLGTVTITASATMYVGFAVTSRNATNNTFAQFRDFSDNTNTTIGFTTANVEPLGASSRRTGLVFTELMYHPAPRTDARKTEFVELHNSNPFSEDISGFRISGDLSYTFPEGTVIPGGAFIVIARSPGDVQTVYGISKVMGPYTNSLSNKSGTVRLRNRVGAILLEVNYDSKPPWPLAPDGTGHSLVLVRPSLGENHPEAWARSDSVGGSPGQVDGVLVEPARSVVLNEILAHTDLPDVDYIELYNHSATPVNLSGCWLSDDPFTNKFRIPDGTIIGATGFVHFTESQLGFSTASDGETIYFLNSNRTCVIDSLLFEGQENGVSLGRVPDGGAGFYRLAAKTPGAPNGAIRTKNLVINEIMYHPVSDDDNDTYIEIYNRGPGSVNLTGWRFTDGIDFTFPTNTIIASNGYVVVAKNAARLMSNYAGLSAANTYGNFQGTLSGSGEHIALSMPDVNITTNLNGTVETNRFFIPVEEVTYGTGGRWGKWSDGGGSSLELIDPRADNRLAMNWTDSDDTAKSVWSTLSVTGLLDHAADGNSQWNALQLYLLDAGECLVDNVSFRFGPTVGSLGLNIVTNGGFENNGLLNWFPQGDHRYSFLENAGDASAHSLHVVAQDRGDTGANRIFNQLIDQYTTNVMGVISTRVKWLHGRPEIIFRLRGNHLELAGVMPVPKNLGTPGARNSRYITNAPPAITDIIPNPVLPGANDPVVVSARVHDPDGVASAQLVYRFDPFPLGSNVLPMNDNGTNGDAVAGDGIYSTRIPGQVNNTMLAYYIQTTDGAASSATSRFPNGAPTNECLVHFGEIQPIASFASYRFWMTQATLDDWQTHDKFSSEVYKGTFVYGNSRVIYNAGSHYAGSPAHAKLYDSPLGTNCDYQLLLPADDALLDETSLRIQEPGLFGADRTCQNESLGYWIVGQMGVPALNRRPINMFVNGQRRGIIYEDTQRQNRSFNQQWYPNADENENDLYRIGYWYEFGNDPFTHRNDTTPSLRPFTTAGGVKKLAIYRQTFNKRAVQGSPHNYTNLFNLVDVLDTTATGDQYAAEVFPWIDVWEWARSFAAERILNNTDLYGAKRIVSATETKPGAQNSFIFKPGGDTWKFLIWDIDAAFLGTPVDPLFDFTDPPISNLFAHPYVLRTYWQALQDAAYGPLMPQNLHPVMDAKFAAFQAVGLDATSPQPMKTYLGIRRDYILQLLSENNAPFSLTSNNGNDFTNLTTLVTLNGTAPFGVRTITINGVAYNLSWSSVSNWSVRVPLTGQTNHLAIKGLDANGADITNASKTLTVYFTGPVARAEDSLVFNKVMFQPAVSNAHYIEIFNRSTNTTFSLAGFRLKGVDFDFGPQHVISPQSFYVVVKNIEAFDAAYNTAVPVAGEYSGDLDRDGETITLLRLAQNTNETDTVITKVKYQITTPWPSRPGTTNGGVALQLIDPSQDNARVSNWDDGTGWKFFTYTGRPQSQRLSVWLDTIGEVFIDEISLVLGDVPGVGPNLLNNGNFEAPLATGWQFVNTYQGNTLITNAFPKYGSNCLRFAPTKSGSSSTAMVQDVIPTLSSSSDYTISFWYKPTTNANNLTVRIGGSAFQATTSVRPVTPIPGVMNPMAGNVFPYPKLWINEVQPNNVNTLLDNTGVAQPWIELFNSGTNTIPLDGLSLSKSYTNLNMWSFPPNTLLLPGQFRVVFVDGNPLLSTGSVLHTSFRLDPTNGALVLSISNQILDYINYGALAPDQSYGSTPDGQLFTRQAFFFATPGASNNATPVPVVINEWMASNTKTIVDPLTSQFEDWFELYNAFSQPIDLSGYFITNEKDNHDKWQIPNGTIIAPYSFLLCWADNAVTNNITTGNALHTSFKLSKSGDYLALYTPAQVLVDQADFSAQTNDVSEGRFPDGNVNGVFFKMRSATPRTNNVIATNGFAPLLYPIANYIVNEGATLTFTNRAFDPDLPAQVLTFSLAPGAPEGAQVDANTGFFSWQTLEIHGPGVYPITVVVSDNSVPSYTDTKTFQVTVNESNTPPSINTITDRTTYADTPVALSVIVTDVDLPAQSFTYELLTPLAGASIDASGLFTWTPTIAQAGTTNPITVKATDSGAPSFSATQSFFIVVNSGVACPGLKGNVSPRGAPDSSVGASDFTLIGRFYAGLATISNACELTRADCSPAPCGDGRIRLGDWVVAGRYAAQLDVPPNLANCSGTNPIPQFNGGPGRIKTAGARTLSFTNTTIARGTTNSFSVILDSQGNENALGFDFIFDTNLLTFVTAQVGADATSAQQFFVNTQELSSGLIGLTLILPSDATFPAGRREVVKVSFRAHSGSNTASTPLVFADGPEVPIPADITDVIGNSLSFTYRDGSAKLISDTDFLFTGLERQTNGVKLQMEGPAGVWQLQGSSNLFNWDPIFPLTNTSGAMEYLDSTATNAVQRIYKAVKQ